MPPACSTDIHWHAHPEYRGEQALNLSCPCCLHRDRPSPAAPICRWPIFYRSRRLIDEVLSPRIRELVSIRLMERARALGATLRVGSICSPPPCPTRSLVHRTRVGVRDKTLALVLPAAPCAAGRGSRAAASRPGRQELAGLEPAMPVCLVAVQRRALPCIDFGCDRGNCAALCRHRRKRDDAINTSSSKATKFPLQR